MKSSQKLKFDPAHAAALIPGQAKLQKDLAGRPIKVGDRVDDTECHGGGIVVSVFGNSLIYLVDYHNGHPQMGSFTYASCSAVRVLQPVTDIESAVAEILSMRRKLDRVQAKISRRPDPDAPQSSECTRILPEQAKDATGRQVEIGDLVIATESATCSSRGGIVIGIASNLLLIEDRMEEGSRGFDAVQSDHTVVQPREVRRA